MSSRSPLLPVLAMGTGLFVGSMGVYMVPLQIGALIVGLELTESWSGILGGLEVAAMALTAIFISPRMATWSGGKTAFNGVLFALVCQLLTSVVQGSMLLLLLRTGAGMGCGCAFAAVCATAAATNNPDRNFGAAQAVMNSLFLVMFLIAPLSLDFGVHRGLFMLLAFTMALTLPLFRYLTVAGQSTETQTGEEMKIRRGLALLHILATVSLNIGLGALWGFSERIGTIHIGLSTQVIGNILSAATLFMIAGSLFAAWLGARFGRAMPMALAAVICALSALAIALGSSWPVYAGGLFVYNFAYLFLGPYIIAGTSSALDASGRLAAAMGGIMFLSYSMGIASGGFIAEYISLTGIGILACITCLVAAPLFALVSVRLENQETPPKS